VSCANRLAVIGLVRFQFATFLHHYHKAAGSRKRPVNSLRTIYRQDVWGERWRLNRHDQLWFIPLKITDHNPVNSIRKHR
jgi:hypothetical protein